MAPSTVLPLGRLGHKGTTHRVPRDARHGGHLRLRVVSPGERPMAGHHLAARAPIRRAPSATSGDGTSWCQALCGPLWAGNQIGIFGQGKRFRIWIPLGEQISAS